MSDNEKIQKNDDLKKVDDSNKSKPKHSKNDASKSTESKEKNTVSDSEEKKAATKSDSKQDAKKNKEESSNNVEKSSKSEEKSKETNEKPSESEENVNKNDKKSNKSDDKSDKDDKISTKSEENLDESDKKHTKDEENTNVSNEKNKSSNDAKSSVDDGLDNSVIGAIEEIDPSEAFDKPKHADETTELKVNPAAKYAFAREQAKEQARKNKKRTIIIAICVTVAVILAVCGAILFSFANSGFDDDEDINALQELSETSFDEPFYMLLVGTDTREGDNSYSLEDGRSDSCILVRIDPKTFIIDMMSIPRDTKMTVNGSTEKFNSAYAEGGIAATIKAAKKLTGVDISHYAEISFNGLTDLVDAVGGVEVDVPNEIDDYHIGVYVPAGRQTLNGEQALAFSRSRNFADGDFTRTADQRVLIDALIKKAYTIPLTDLPNVIKAAKKFVKTDFTLADIVGLAKQFMQDDKQPIIYSTMVPSYNDGSGGVSYVSTDKDALRRMIALMENGEDPNMVEITSGASICSSRDLPALLEKQKAYYAEHPDSVGRATNKSSSKYDDDDDYGYSSSGSYGYDYSDYSSYSNSSYY